MKKYEQLQEQINAAEERLKKVKEDIKKLLKGTERNMKNYQIILG